MKPLTNRACVREYKLFTNIPEIKCLSMNTAGKIVHFSFICNKDIDKDYFNIKIPCF